MLNVIICDDSQEVVDYVTKVVENYLFIEEISNVKIELATTDQYEVLNLFVKKEILRSGTEKWTSRQLKQRLLFLDINFGSDLPHFDGIKLAQEIRKHDITSSIVFITNNGLEQRDIITYKIEPLGYIHKVHAADKMQATIIDLIETARERLYMSTINRRMIRFQTERGEKYVNLSDVCYVQGNDRKDRNKLQDQDEGSKHVGLSVLHTLTECEPLTKALKVYDEDIPYLIRLGRSYLVNPLNVRAVRASAKKAKLIMNNGSELSVQRKSFDTYKIAVEALYESGLI
ncbi:MAG: LytTR family transcriptional regulator DNA-binding domain-containing protein [Defluviitaleaceae bacterium]|nr:LytTR family transcriptional regulator DNA-binding domain-containing protein [Defluviitaleaceae bacterium]